MSPFQETMLIELQAMLERLQTEQQATDNETFCSLLQVQIDNVKERIALYN